MLAVAADKTRADGREATERDTAHRGVLVDVAVRAELYATQSAIWVDGGVIVENGIEDGAAVFDNGALAEGGFLNVTVFPYLDLISIES